MKRKENATSANLQDPPRRTGGGRVAGHTPRCTGEAELQDTPRDARGRQSRRTHPEMHGGRGRIANTCVENDFPQTYLLP